MTMCKAIISLFCCSSQHIGSPLKVSNQLSRKIHLVGHTEDNLARSKER
jgi:hypothetical protein